MTLKGRRTGSADYSKWIKALICGEPGSGKTLISSTFPNVLYASAEGGMMSVYDRNVLTVDIESRAQVDELLTALRQPLAVRTKMLRKALELDEDPIVDTIVIDTIDEIARIIQRERVKEQHHEAMQMQDWGWFADQLRDILRGFRNLDMHVIFTCHVKNETDGETGAMSVRPSIQGSVGDEIAQYFDLAVLLQARPHTETLDGEVKRSIVRYVQTYPDGRHDWIKDRSGKLPMEFPVNFENDYKRLEELIFGAVDVVERVQTDREKAQADVEELARELATPAESVSSTETVPVDDVVAEEPPTEAESVPVVEEVPSTPSEAPPSDLTCQKCGGEIESVDQKDLSEMRFRESLCRKCFSERKTQK